MTLDEVKELIFFCPFKLYNDFIVKKVQIEDNLQAIPDSSDCDTESLSERLSVIKKYRNANGKDPSLDQNEDYDSNQTFELVKAKYNHSKDDRTNEGF